MLESTDCPVVQLRGIFKLFPGVRALDGVSLDIRRGEVLALLGENGAGKSTLMGVLSGIHARDAGEILMDGCSVPLHGPRAAQAAGIAMIHQELSVIDGLTVAENIFLGREPARCGLRAGSLFSWPDRRRMNAQAETLLSSLGLPLRGDTPLGSLRVGCKQVVEIAKAMSLGARVLIMDEPTSALSDQDTERLLRIMADLRAQGTALVFVTHRLPEVFQIADRVSVLRDGRHVSSYAIGDADPARVIHDMVGREIQADDHPASAPHGAEVLRVDHFSVFDRLANRPVVDDVSLCVHEGEIVGLAGLLGAGRSELLEALFGVHSACTRGRVVVGGQVAAISSPEAALRWGLALAPEDRKRQGLVLSMSVIENTTLASLADLSRHGFVHRRRETAEARRLARALDIRTPALDQAVRTLSGGNQQKVVLAKCLLRRPRVLLLDEPTRGIDVGARHELYTILRRLVSEGLAVVLASSDLPELLDLAHRVYVMCQGRVVGELAREALSEERLMTLATRFRERAVLA